MYILDNPEFIRLRRTKLRLRGLIVLGSIAMLVYGGTLATMWYITTTSPWAASDMMNKYFFTAVGIQLAIGTLYTLMLGSQNITMERERNTYDFQRLVAMGPWRLALGKLFGAGCESWCLALSGAFFAFIPVMAGVIPASVFMTAQIVVVMSTLVAGSFGLMASSVVAKTAQATGLIFFFIFIGFSAVGVGVAGAGGRVGEPIWLSANPVRVITELYYFCTSRKYVMPVFGFFGLKVPLLAGFLLLNGFFAALMFVVTVRRLADEELSYIKPGHAAIAFGIFQLLLIGGDWASLSSAAGNSKGLAFFHIFNLWLLMALAYALIPSPELLRARISRGRPNEHWKIFFERTNRLQDSPPITCLLLFGLVYVVLAGLLTVSANVLTAPAFLSIAMVFSAGIATAALLVYLSVYTDKGALRVGAFIMGILFIVPPMLVVIVTSENRTVAVSPFSYLSTFGSNPAFSMPGRSFHDQPSAFACPLICIASGMLLTILGAMRVRFMLDMDQAQREREAELAKAAPETAQAAAAARVLAAVSATNQPQNTTEIIGSVAEQKSN